jgi:hypothetical protein
MMDFPDWGAPAILVLLIALISARAGVGLMRFLRRRRSLQAFAAAHGWTFHSVLRSDARPPYTRLRELRRTALLWNILEGQWNGHAVAIFDRKPRRRILFTGVLVTVGGRMRSLHADWDAVRHAGSRPDLFGSLTTELLTSGPPLLLEADDNVLYATAGDARDGATLGDLLDLATGIATAMVAEAERAPAISTSA